MKSSRSGRGVGRGSSAIVDVVQRRQADRLAKIAAIVTMVVVAPTVATVGVVASGSWLAVAVGVIAGAVLAGLVGLVVFIWPGLRLCWWWAAEITTLALLLGAFVGLSLVMPWAVALALLLAVVVAPLVWSKSRRWLLGWCWCVISRHRLRTCFATFIRANRYGSLPWLLWARPTPAGERLWVWLRPGLSLEDLTSEDGLARLAVGCWASEVRIQRASRRTAALLRVDITRRNPLAGIIANPLPGQVPDLDIPLPTPDAGGVLGGLDLPDIPEQDTSVPTSPAAAGASTASRSKPSPKAAKPAVAAVVSRSGEDLSDWV